VIRALILLMLLATPAMAHSWYSGAQDPVTHGTCCGGSDCGQFVIKPGRLFATAEGYRIVLTLEETRAINRSSTAPIDAVVTWARVQPSQDGNWHICLKYSDRTPPTSGIYCLFVPPNT
jgi:hypothetical protein